MSFSFRVIQPTNLLSAVAATQFHSEITHAIDSGTEIILVDLRNIRSVSNDTFLALLKGLKLAQASKCKVFVCSLNEQLRILFELTGLDQLLEIFADSNEFRQYIQPATKVEVFRQPRSSAKSLKVAV